MLDDAHPITTPIQAPTAATSDRITLRFLAAPGDVTVSGTAVPAGKVLEWIDRAAYACAVGWSSKNAVTAYVGDINFARPIKPGDLVEVHARIVLTGTSSMHVLVSVECSDVRTRRFIPAMHCLIVMVAVDDDGKPSRVPEWQPWTDGDRTLSQRARDRIEPRRRIQKAMAAAEYTQLGTAPRTVFRFLASPADASWGGQVQGGSVMRWIDETAFACAASWSSTDAVAVYAGGISFERPISVGDIVEVDARIIHTSERAMHVSVRVRSGPTTAPFDLEPTTQCTSVFVSPKNGKAEPVAPLPLVTEEDHALDAHALELIEMRKGLSIIPSGLVRYN